LNDVEQIGICAGADDGVEGGVGDLFEIVGDGGDEVGALLLVGGVEKIDCLNPRTVLVPF
jgi:hypothetical protein